MPALNKFAAGFSLIEVLTATGVIAVITLGVSASISLLTRVEQNTRAVAEIQNLESTLKQQLAKVKVCKEIMGAVGSAANPAGTTISSTTVGSSQPYSLYVYNKSPPNQIFLGATPAASPNKNILGQIEVKTVTLEVLQASVGTTTTRLIANLHFSIRKLATAGNLGPQIFDSYIPLNLVLNSANELISCSLFAADIVLPQCGPGQHLVLNVQSGGPTPTQWVCQ